MPALLLSLFLAPALPALAQRPEIDEAQHFIQELLERARTKGRECPEAIRESRVAETVVCADYQEQFSRFKSDWDDFVGQFEYRTAKSMGPWYLKGGVYKRQYDFEGTIFTVGFQRDSRLLWVSYPEPDAKPDFSEE